MRSIKTIQLSLIRIQPTLCWDYTTNKSYENGRKYIAINEPVAKLIRWAFDTLCTGLYSSEHVLNEARKKGLKCSKNNFYMLIRNPVYCGKIFVPKYKDEEEMLVQGQHEPLISEQHFQQVQEFLSGRKKVQRTLVKYDENLPLRGFLLCPECGRTLTGSASKGRHAYYHYYHCKNPCTFRFKAPEANEAIVQEIKKYTPHPAVIILYKKVVSEVYKCEAQQLNGGKKQLLTLLDEQNKKVSKARELLLCEAIDASDYKIIKTECEQQISELENKLTSFSTQKEDIDDILEKACEKIGKLDKLYINGTTEEQQKLLGSIFPEKITFENNTVRTATVNEAIRLIYSIDAAFREKKNGASVDINILHRQVSPQGLFSNQDLLKISELSELHKLIQASSR